MECSASSVMIYLFLVSMYGSAFAAVNVGLTYFSPALFQTIRMFSGFCFCLLVLTYRYITSENYRTLVRVHFTAGWGPILNVLLAGLINLGVPHCLITIGQKWVTASTVQLMQPFNSAAGGVIAHFMLADEKLDGAKITSLIVTFCGVVITSLPSFMLTSSSTVSLSNVILGYVLIIVAMVIFGLSPAFMKRFIPNVDVTVSSTLQTIASTAFNFLFSMVSDGFTKFRNMILVAPTIAWMWPVVVGSVTSGLCLHLYIYLNNTAGTFACNLIPSGQILVGVGLGIALGDWDLYEKKHIAISVVGIALIFAGIGISFYHPMVVKVILPEEHAEEEELSHVEILPEEAEIGEL